MYCQNLHTTYNQVSAFRFLSYLIYLFFIIKYNSNYLTQIRYTVFNLVMEW